MSLEIDLPNASIRVKVSDLEKVGAGGEGSVYLLRHQSGTFAIKRYHQPSQERIQKLEAAIAARPVNAVFGEGDDAIVQMAWPLGLVREHGESLGFVMPYVDSKKAMELDYFISPVLAKDARHLEKPNLAVRLQIAQNLCSVVNSLHEVGHYFIDFKPQNIKVYPRSLHVCLIDCDSFSVTHNGVRYPASAYSPQFINPIALVNDQPPSALGEEQDNWAIAVALFMLLNFDLHPYDGRASPSVTVTAVDDFVKMGLYAYGPRPHPLVTPKPASVHNLWPSELRALFDRAFTDPQRAPTMSEWVQYLQSILQNKLIARCDSKPNAVDHLRFLGNGCMQCAFESRQKPRAIKQRPAKPRSVEPPAAPKPSPVTNSSKPSFPYNVPIPAQRKMSGEAKAFWGLLIFFLIVFFINSQQETPDPRQIVNVAPSTPPSPPTPQADSAPRTSYFYSYPIRKPKSSGVSLVTEEIRWCAYQDYRISYLKLTVSDNLLKDIREEFNSLCVNKKLMSDVRETIETVELANPGLQQALKGVANLD